MEYQNTISKHLKSMIFKHTEILRHCNYTQKTFNATNFIYFCNSVPVGLYTIMILYSPAYQLHHRVLAGILFFGSAFYLNLGGQMFENACEQMSRAIYDMNWYTWNLENQKAYLLLYVNSSQIMNVPLMSTFKVNFELFKKIMRGTYSFVNIMYSMNINIL
nr:odorant receptor 33 [Pachyrhinus yasumatsui]